MDLKELAVELESASRRGAKARTDALLATAEEVAEAQREAVPVRSGRLKASIEISGVDGEELGSTAEAVEIGPTSPLAPLIEFGTSDTAPQPFVYNHAEKALDALARRLEQGDPL